MSNYVLMTGILEDLFGHQAQMTQQTSFTHIYRFAVVPYGASSSPFMLATVLD